MNNQVTKCADCPLYDWDSCDCNHPWKGIGAGVIYADEINYPSWCPLIKEPLTISLKQE